MKTKTGTTNARIQSSRQKPVSLLFTSLMAVLLVGVAVAGCKGNGNSGKGSSGKVLVPAITGMTLTDAINALAGVKLFTLAGSGDLTGTVASVSPVEGTAVDIYSVVTVTMSAIQMPLPTPTTVTAPDLSGMKLPDALKTLGGFGLYAVPTGTDFNGSVTAQDPAAGTTVNVGSEVTISLDMLLRPATTTSNTGSA